ncbi:MULTISPECIES: KpsE/CtrB/VexD-like capsular polysaccharide export protein [Rhizobium]|uniref:Capsular polysaccharide transport system permease protein n=1 Tax=Rhizobium tropici TaxID=398 RepID=A0A6P1CAF8_RHITR|nr:MULTISPECIES: KpsE/CtrB/VexD-like capsular polysaccharide export protein [Rhizobium]AGB70770.1 putative KpsE/CtrB/VexD-like capsular polysaccharide export protein [Rhizobium tropici CIAT 899]MBB4244896.1 capsular polysaccharide transport system permease protein [Rhizobium tropici]MBB5596354.1 capsular polysaccharide transport system permease protein [Rhizobium tropici]MBB6495236.1 capsular polysaccharide transport system permease protein [Rhizobium tropici]NEV14129.1 capsule biosynthesis pr
MPKPIIEDAIVQDSPRVRTSRQILPSLFRRKLPAQRARTDLEEIEYIPVHDGNEPETQSGGKPPLRLIGFILLVILPFLASSVYYAFIASDQYVAEARFAVRAVSGTGDTSDASDPGGATSALNMRSASQDAYVVTSFIHSTEILNRIGKKIDYRSMFIRQNADFLSRFGSSRSDEEFLKYWNDHVTAYIDVTSGIITLKVRTFSPDDSVKLADAIIEESEKLINELSERARNDIVQSMKADVQKSGKAYGDTLIALNQFQNASGLLSPQTQAKNSGTILTGLLAQKLEFETRLFVMRQSNAQNSPTYQQLNLAKESLDAQIEKMKSALTGPENASLAKSLLEYSRLETDRMIAEKLYESSQKNYDAVLAEALRKTLYLAVFVKPVLPDESIFPRRVSTPLIILLALIVTWATLSLIWASVEDHRI